MEDNVINPGTPAPQVASETTTQETTTATTTNGVDLSDFMGEDGHTLDYNKVTELYNNAEKYKKSAAFSKVNTNRKTVCRKILRNIASRSRRILHTKNSWAKKM